MLALVGDCPIAVAPERTRVIHAVLKGPLLSNLVVVQPVDVACCVPPTHGRGISIRARFDVEAWIFAGPGVVIGGPDPVSRKTADKVPLVVIRPVRIDELEPLFDVDLCLRHAILAPHSADIHRLRLIRREELGPLLLVHMPAARRTHCQPVIPIIRLSRTANRAHGQDRHCPHQVACRTSPHEHFPTYRCKHHNSHSFWVSTQVPVLNLHTARRASNLWHNERCVYGHDAH